MITSILLIENPNQSIDPIKNKLIQDFPNSKIRHCNSQSINLSEDSDLHQFYKNTIQYDLIILDCRELRQQTIHYLETIRTLYPEKIILIKSTTKVQQSFQDQYASFFPSQTKATFHTPFQSQIVESQWLIDFRNTLELRSALQKQPISIPNWYPHKLLHSTPQSGVYLAKNKQSKKSIIKIFSPPDQSISSLQIDVFINEVSQLAKIQSQLIVNIIDYGIDNNTPYIVMEYIGKTTLKNIIEKKGPINIEQALIYFKSILKAVLILHKHHLLHRDIKPSNIMLNKKGSIVLIDCSIESNWLIATEQIKEEEIYCTPFYISPERAASEPCTVSSEIYNLGILFYEIITGYKPYNGSSLIDIIKAHALAPIPSLPPKAQQYQLLFEKMAAKHPDDRYQSVQQIINDFETIKSMNNSSSL